MMRCRVSEMPHKIPHYAALLARLSTNAIAPPASLASRLGGAAKITPAAGRSPPRAGAPSETETKEGGDAEGTAEAAAEVEEESKPAAPEPEKVNVGHAIVQDLAKAFQAFLDERKWKSVRYLVRREFPRIDTALLALNTQNPFRTGHPLRHSHYHAALCTSRHRLFPAQSAQLVRLCVG